MSNSINKYDSIQSLIRLIKSSPEALKEGIKDIDLRTLNENSINIILENLVITKRVFTTFFPENDIAVKEKCEKMYILIDNPKGGISINSKVNKRFLIQFYIHVISPEKLKYLIEKYNLNYNLPTEDVKKRSGIKLHNFKERLGIRLLCLSIENNTDKITEVLLGYISIAACTKKEMTLILNTLYNTQVKYSNSFDPTEFDAIKFYNLFIDRGININVEIDEESGYNTLMSSILADNKEIFDLLIKMNRDRNNIDYIATDIAKNKYTPLNVAIAVYNNIYYAKKLIEKGANVNYIAPKNTMKDSKVFENISILQEAIYEKDNIENVKLLLEHGADKNNKETTTHKNALEIAKDKYDSDKKYYGEVIKLLGGKMETELWKGFSRSDIQKFDIFFENPFDWSCCPICLEYIERSAACMYMSHNCATTGHYYHEKLYDAYVYDSYGNKNVEWCTICGRITEFHKHFILTDAKNPNKTKAPLKPEIQAQLDRGDNVAFFDNANCIGFGGGGTEEKAERFRRLREYALTLQNDVDKREHDEVMKELIEVVWDSALVKSEKVKNILKNKTWNINIKEFPENKKNTRNNNSNSNAANVPFGGRVPTVKEGGDCIIYADEDEGEASNPTYQFHHETVGGLDHDGIYICQKDLAKAVQLKCKEFGLENFGQCWFSQCKGILHPEELKGIIPEVLYEEYRKKFNKKMVKSGGKRTTRKIKKQKGGNVKSVLHELTDGTCAPPNLTKNGKLRNRTT